MLVTKTSTPSVMSWKEGAQWPKGKEASLRKLLNYQFCVKWTFLFAFLTETAKSFLSWTAKRISIFKSFLICLTKWTSNSSNAKTFPTKTMIPLRSTRRSTTSGTQMEILWTTKRVKSSRKAPKINSQMKTSGQISRSGSKLLSTLDLRTSKPSIWTGTGRLSSSLPRNLPFLRWKSKIETKIRTK